MTLRGATIPKEILFFSTTFHGGQGGREAELAQNKKALGIYGVVGDSEKGLRNTHLDYSFEWTTS